MTDHSQNTIIKRQRTGNEAFVVGGKEQSNNVLSFWQWAHSDLLGNALRGILAEYIVATAIGAKSGIREEWDAFDLTTACGLKIEVKSSSYLQSWEQQRPTRPIFDIEPKRAWQSNNKRGDAMRHADIYIFCLFAHQDLCIMAHHPD